jgi:hypothetical protein
VCSVVDKRSDQMAPDQTSLPPLKLAVRILAGSSVT